MSYEFNFYLKSYNLDLAVKGRKCSFHIVYHKIVRYDLGILRCQYGLDTLKCVMFCMRKYFQCGQGPLLVIPQR